MKRRRAWFRRKKNKGARRGGEGLGRLKVKKRREREEMRRAGSRGVEGPMGKEARPEEELGTCYEAKKAWQETSDSLPFVQFLLCDLTHHLLSRVFLRIFSSRTSGVRCSLSLYNGLQVETAVGWNHVLFHVSIKRKATSSTQGTSRSAWFSFWRAIHIDDWLLRLKHQQHYRTGCPNFAGPFARLYAPFTSSLVPSAASTCSAHSLISLLVRQ